MGRMDIVARYIEHMKELYTEHTIEERSINLVKRTTNGENATIRGK